MRIQPGKTFGRLTVSKDIGRSNSGDVLLRCCCSCSNKVVATASNVRLGKVKSCGCLRREVSAELGKRNYLKHGHARVGQISRTFKSWQQMHQRAGNKDGQHPTYANVSVCERWKSFNNFLADMGERPAGKSLDRIHNDQGYNPENCQWSTPAQQVRNRRNTVLTEEAVACIRRIGDKLSSKDLAECFRVSATTIQQVLSGERWARVAA